jgi:hypothetical protein
MRKWIALGVCTVLAVAPAAAQAKPKKPKVYRGTFQAVGSDGAYTTGKFGKAQLVDGKRNDKLSVHVRHLGSRTKYVFRLQQAATACEEGAPGGTDVPGWRYRRGGVLKTSRRGVANSWARSHTFTADPGTAYFVGIFTATPSGDPGDLVLCAALHTKAKKPKPEKTHKPKKPKKPHPAKGGGRPVSPGKSGDHGPKTPDRPRGNGPDKPKKPKVILARSAQLAR